MEISITKADKIGKLKMLIVPMFEDIPFAKTCPEEIKDMVELRRQDGDFEGKEGQSLLLFPDYEGFPVKVLLIGFGKKAGLNATKVRCEVAVAIKSAKNHKVQEVGFYMVKELYGFAQSIAEGFVLSNYNPAKYQTGKKKEENEKKDVKKVFVVSAENNRKAEKEYERALDKGLQIGEAANLVRDLVNGPHNMVNADVMVEEAEKAAKQSNSSVLILEEKDMEKMGMGAMLGVGEAAEYEPKMVIMEYKAKGAVTKAPVVIVGKGITFDSGGYNLKPSQGMDAMKMDKAGAAAIIGTFRLLKKLGIRRNVIGILAITENLIGPTAQKPNDIVTAYNGKTIEVANTDAEGRLILADAIAYGVKKYKPDCVIDLATLTGAIIVALGERHAGLFSNDKELGEKLVIAGESTDELVWPMPIHEDVKEKVKGKLADLVNWESSGMAGPCKGAAFIEEFVGGNKWAHIDIAGTAYVKEPKKYDHHGATGYGVRLLIEFLEQI